MEQMKDRKLLKKSQNYFDHDHGKKTKRILYIYVVLRAGKFFKVFVFCRKNSLWCSGTIHIVLSSCCCVFQYAQGRSYFWLNSVFHLWHVMNYRVFKMDWRHFKELLLWHVFGLPQIIAWMMLPTRYMNS